MTAKVLLQSDKHFHVSGLHSIDAVIKIQEAQQMLGNKLRHQISDTGTSFPLPSQFTLPDLCTTFSTEEPLNSSSVAEDNTVVCGNDDSLVGSQNCLVSSEHMPLHEVMISSNKLGVDAIPFTLREESVFRQIVRNGNVEFCPDVAILTEPVSPEAVSWFLPGDQLVAVNDVIIDSKDEAWHRVAECKLETLKLSVRPLAELSELSLRYIHCHGDRGHRKVSYTSSSQQHNTPVDTCKGHAEDKVWLVHKTGFTSAVRVPENNSASLPPSECCLVRLNYSNTYVQAKKCDLHQMNPVQYDLAEDLASLPCLNESSVLHILQQRYYSNLIHTFAGKKTLLVVRPLHPLSVYTEEVTKMLEYCQLRDLPPHIYSIARSAYESLRKTTQSQSIVLLGHSGSGKTTNVYHILEYLCLTTAVQSCRQKLCDSVAAAVTMLESFCNCHTIQNTNATRCAHLIKLQYDICSKKLVGIAVEIFLMDDMRFAHRPNAESAYTIFYQFLAGVDSAVREELLLKDATEPNLFMTQLHQADDVKEAIQSWHQTLHAMHVLGFSDGEVSVVCAVLAAVYHLGVAGAVIGTDSFQFARCIAAARAASVLGVSLQTLSDCIFSPADATHPISAIDRLENFVSSLYSQLLRFITYLMNRMLSAAGGMTSQQHLVITVADTPGFQNPTTCGRRDGATFTDLCQNYIQERLCSLYRQSAVTSVTRLHMKENIECEVEVTAESKVDVAHLLDSVHHNVGCMSSIHSKKTHSNYCGLFSLLSQISKQSSGNDNELLASFTQQFSDCCVRKVEETSGSLLLEFDHLNQTNSVQYNVQGWTKMVRMASKTLQLQTLFHTSSRNNIKELFGSLNNVENPVVNCLHLKSTVDRMLEPLQCSDVYFVHCLLPHYTAAAAICKPLTSAVHNSSLDMCLLRTQLRGVQVLDALHIQKQGYSVHMPFDDFLREFQILQPCGKRGEAGSKKAVKMLLEYLNVSNADYKLGLTRVFFNSEAFAHLTEMRDNKIFCWISRFQALLRGYLSRSRLTRRTVEVQLEEEIVKKQELLKAKHDVANILQQHSLSEQRREPDSVVRQMKMKLKKARLLVVDVQQSCSHHQQVAAEANKQSRLAVNNVEDLQTRVAAASRARKCLASEVNELHAELMMYSKAQLEDEERWKQLAAENTELQSQVSERDDEIDELMKKYKALVQKNAMELATLQDQSAIIQNLQSRVEKQKSDFDTIQMRLRFFQETSVSKEMVSLLEAKVRELESRMSFEVASRIRAEKLAKRLKCQIDKTHVDEKWQTDVASNVKTEVGLQKQVRDLQQQLCAAGENSAEASLRCQQLEKKLHLMEVECVELCKDLEFSNRRVKDLQESLAATSSSQVSLDSSDCELDEDL